MRRISILAASATLFTTMAFADSFSGKLIDASCATPEKMAAKQCDAGSSTTAFALVVEGKAYKLDDSGNKKAMEAIKNRAERAADPNNPQATQVTAKVTGD